MSPRATLLAALILCSACMPRRTDTSHPAVCEGDATQALNTVSDAELATAAAQSAQVVRGRLSFTGTFDVGGTIYRYVIADVVDVVHGSLDAADPKLKEELPIYAPAADAGPLDRLMCREGDTFLFLVSVPDANAPPDAGVPAAVAQVYGPHAVALHAVLGEHEAGRLGSVLNAAPGRATSPAP